MNKIIYARRENLSGEITTKSFEILIPDSGRITVIPPLKKHCAEFEGIRIIFDHALLPFNDICEIDDSEDGAIAFCAKQALKYFESGTAKVELILASLGNLLISYVTAFGTEKQFSPVVELVRAEIAKGVSDCSFSIQDALKKLPLNYDYIRKLFKKETGATPYEYLLKERMALAQQLILSGISNKFSSYTISQISEACGYSEPLYFSRVFKQYFGVSPSEYK
ncbi:MAG: helix-turn-helix transcriptional regulator [Clostridia bacterium]|nr:helix-turn-helix transcriptional regulator [Clostridia bacterium]